MNYLINFNPFMSQRKSLLEANFHPVFAGGQGTCP
jgi:hypothetical protein